MTNQTAVNTTTPGLVTVVTTELLNTTLTTELTPNATDVHGNGCAAFGDFDSGDWECIVIWVAIGLAAGLLHNRNSSFYFLHLEETEVETIICGELSKPLEQNTGTKPKMINLELLGKTEYSRESESRENNSVPKPPPPNPDKVHQDERGNKYKLDTKGNKVYISDESDSEPEIPRPRPPAADPSTRYNPGYQPDPEPTAPMDYPSRLPPSPPRGQKDHPSKRKSPPPPTPPKPPSKKPVAGRNFLGVVQQLSGQLDHGQTYDDVDIENDHGQTYDDVEIGKDHGEVYDPVSPSADFGQSYIMPHPPPQESLDYGGEYEETDNRIGASRAHIHQHPTADWGENYEVMNSARSAHPPRLPLKPTDFGEDYEQPTTRSPPSISPRYGKQEGYKKRPIFPLPSEHQEPYEETPMGFPISKGVVDPADIKLEEFIDQDVYQNEPVMNPKAKSSAKYKNLHMTRGEKVESEKPYVYRR